MNTQWDVLGIGCSTVDDFLVVDPFPTPDTKQEVVTVDRQGGGLVATALVAVARLGARCAYVGVVGEDEASRWIEEDLQREGIDTSLVEHQPDAQPIHAFIIVAGQTRTILYTVGGKKQHSRPDYPPLEVISAARVLLVDDVIRANIPQVIRAAKTARAADIPVIADFEMQPHEELLAVVDHLIVSAHFAERVTGKKDPADAASALWQEGRAAVIVTCGTQGCWYLTSENASPTHFPAFTVETVDTTGCGDVFHGAYAASLAWGWTLEQRIRLGSACAAMKATQLGGRRGIPALAEVEKFLKTSS